jgi:DNA-binding HxlR family transcriptional regulator
MACNPELELSEVQQARQALEHITNKWSVLILTVLCPKPARFNEIMRRLDGITHKALADALKRLERNGLVTRRVIPTTPIGVEYTITPLGHSLREPFETLYAWALQHGPTLQRAQITYDTQGAARMVAS